MRYERSLGIADRIEKLIELIRTGKYSTPALAEKLRVSEQTIYRDVLFLKQRGYSIRAVRQPQGWAYHFLSEPEAAIQGVPES
jgi:biotin operon repressor